MPTLTQKLTKELADHFGWRPWREMAKDRADLRALLRSKNYDINEPTRQCCQDAATDLLAIVAGHARELAAEATEHPMAQVYVSGAFEGMGRPVNG